MDEKEIRSFLVAQPRGAKIIVRTQDDENHEIAAPNGKGLSWAHVARSIDALEHVYIELQDADGRLLRATKTTGAKAEPLPATLTTPLHSDPETARLTHFANLLSDAYKFSTGLAFQKMVELSQMSVERMMAIEQRLERTEANYRREMQERLNEAFERADDMATEAEERATASANDPTAALLQSFTGGMNAGGGHPPPTPTNGKGKA